VAAAARDLSPAHSFLAAARPRTWSRGGRSEPGSAGGAHPRTAVVQAKRRRDGAFRSWLRQITLNRIRAFQKTRRKRPVAGGGVEVELLLTQLEDPASDIAQQWDRDHDHHVFQKLLAIVKPDFEPATWQAFTRFALDGQPAARVADELGMSEREVIQAKYRILKRLRAEAGDLID
jgi:RNA polymerase sigma-70 factor, ECF subfamily